MLALPRDLVLQRVERFLELAAPLQKPDQAWSEYATTREVEAQSHEMIFFGAWLKALQPELRAVYRATEPAEVDRQVNLYFRRMRKRLTRQARDAGSRFERELALGARDALIAQYRKMLGNDDTKEAVFCHTLKLRQEGGGAYRRYFPNWHVSDAGFERRLEVKETTASTPKQRMIDVGVHGSVARTGLKVGDRPPSQRDGCKHPVNEYLSHIGQRHLMTQSDVVCSIGASFETSRAHLDKFTTPDPAIKGNFAMLKEAYRRNWKELGLTAVPWITEDTLEKARVNYQALPGALWGRIYRDKGESFCHTTKLAKALFRTVGRRLCYAPVSWAVGGREKRQERNVGDQVNSRLVQMPEDPYTRIESAIAEPLLERFKWLKKDVRLGMNYVHGNYLGHYKKYGRCLHVKSFDWSAFDSTAGRELISMAFALMRSHFPDGPEIDRVFVYLLSGFMHRNLVCPGGDIVHMSRGVPSGSGFTSLVGSLVNWLVLRSTINDLAPEEVARSARMSVQGDDSYMGFTLHYGLPSNAEFTARAKELWGLVSGPPAPGTRNEGPLTSCRIAECQTFLSVANFLGLPSWRLREDLLTEVGYRKGKDSMMTMQASWMATGGYPVFAAEVRTFWEGFGRWTQSQPRAEWTHPEWAQAVSQYLWDVGARLHLAQGLEEDIGQFVWGKKGRYRSEWPAVEISRSRCSLPPYQAEVKRGNRGATFHALLNLVCTPSGRRIILDPWEKQRGEYRSPTPTASLQNPVKRAETGSKGSGAKWAVRIALAALGCAVGYTACQLRPWVSRVGRATARSEGIPGACRPLI